MNSELEVSYRAPSCHSCSRGPLLLFCQSIIPHLCKQSPYRSAPLHAAEHNMVRRQRIGVLGIFTFSCDMQAFLARLWQARRCLRQFALATLRPTCASSAPGLPSLRSQTGSRGSEVPVLKFALPTSQLGNAPVLCRRVPFDSYLALTLCTETRVEQLSPANALSMRKYSWVS